MAGNTRMIGIREVGPRDGLQSERAVPVGVRVELVRAPVRRRAGRRRGRLVRVAEGRAVDGRRRRRGRGVPAARSPTGRRLWALVPNAKGAELATAAGVDHLTITVSASPAYSAKNVHMTLDEALAQVDAIRAAAPDAVLDEVISCCFGSPFEGEAITPDDVGRLRRSRPRRRHRPASRWPTPRAWRRRGGSAPCSTPSGPTSACTSTTPGPPRWSTRGRRSTVASPVSTPPSAGSAAPRSPRRRRQPGHRGPRAPPRDAGSTPGSTSTRCSRGSAAGRRSSGTACPVASPPPSARTDPRLLRRNRPEAGGCAGQNGDRIRGGASSRSSTRRRDGGRRRCAGSGARR